MGIITKVRLAHACAWWSLALYLLVAVAAPYLHHDFACHQASPLHCTSCTASQIADNTPDTTVLLVGVLRDAGAAISPERAAHDAAPMQAIAGRSPPSAVC